MKRLLLTLLVTSVVAASAAHAALTPSQVLVKADRARGNVPGLVWTVDMTSLEKGKERDQTLEVKARSEDVLAVFKKPPRVKNQKLLMVGRNMWFIKPGVSKPVPISPRQKLMGQAANGDIASTNYAGDYEGVFDGEEVLDGELCYVLNLQATDKKVTYDRIRYWVSKERLVGVRAEFYTVSGKMFKSAQFRYENSIEYQGEQIPFVSQMVIQDAIRPKEVTTLRYREIEVKSLSDATFNRNLLTR